jgi:molecular chaperone GrpE
MEQSAKEALVARFSDYLEQADTLTATEAEGSVPDLFTLLAELSALKSEVKLESRQVKSALEEFRALFDALREGNTHLAEERERRREQEQAVGQLTQKDLLLDLLDLRDRLQAGHEQALRFRPGWFGRRSAASFVAAMADGMAMNLRRLDEVLARRDVRPLPALREPFDPRIMHAADIAEDRSQPEGRVLRELRTGFLLGDRLLRPAEVVVNRFAGE